MKILKHFDFEQPLQSWIPLYIWGCAPYIFSCGVRQFLESESDISDWLKFQEVVQGFYRRQVL